MEQSIADIFEGPLVHGRLSHPLDRDAIFNIKDMPPVGPDNVYQRVPIRKILRSVDENRDVDILVVPEDPACAVAIQVKRFPFMIGIHDERPGHWKRLADDFATGVRQANENARDGFAQVYLWIFVTADTRYRNGGRWTFDGPGSDFDRRLRDIVSRRGLDPRVGLIQYRWVQPMDRPPFTWGTGHTHLFDLATRAAQPAALTDGLRAFVASASASA